MQDNINRILLIATVVGIWIIVLQNFGVFPVEVEVSNTVRVRGDVGVSGGYVDVSEPLEVDIRKINGWNAANYEAYTLDGESFHSLGCR